jgi:hypothetical protein
MPKNQGGGEISRLRKAIVAQTPSGTDIVECTLDTTDGETVSVKCFISNGGTLDEAYPNLVKGHEIVVGFISGRWTCTTVFNGFDICTT